MLRRLDAVVSTVFHAQGLLIGGVLCKNWVAESRVGLGREVALVIKVASLCKGARPWLLTTLPPPRRSWPPAKSAPYYLLRPKHVILTPMEFAHGLDKPSGPQSRRLWERPVGNNSQCFSPFSRLIFNYLGVRKESF